MASNQSIKKIISEIKSELNSIYPDNEIEGFIRIIFDHFLNYSSTDLLIKQEEEVTSDILIKINDVIQDLKTHRPIQYILGETEFYDLPFVLSDSVLIPRQETEELVDLIIKENQNRSAKILDIGTGSGCIPIVLAKNLLGAEISAIDVSNEALQVAKRNADINKVDVSFINDNILDVKGSYPNDFDIIVSNPPYIRNLEKELMDSNVLDYEPHLALFVSDSDPLIFYRTISEFALKHLKDGGKIYFEINEAFGKETAELLCKMRFSNVRVIKDLNGKDRIVCGVKNL